MTLSRLVANALLVTTFQKGLTQTPRSRLRVAVRPSNFAITGCPLDSPPTCGFRFWAECTVNWFSPYSPSKQACARLFRKPPSCRVWTAVADEVTYQYPTPTPWHPPIELLVRVADGLTSQNPAAGSV